VSKEFALRKFNPNIWQRNCLVKRESGKSPGEIALHWPERKILLVGDALVGDGKPIPQFAEQQL
jgi:hypothetical protein